jgi:hypothetical protein
MYDSSVDWSSIGVIKEAYYSLSSTRGRKLAPKLCRHDVVAYDVVGNTRPPTTSVFSFRQMLTNSNNRPTTATMKTSAALTLAFVASTATAFQSTPSTQLSSRQSTQLYEYIPSGFTKESWATFKNKEKKAKEEQMKKNLGRVGPKGFQSRSFQSFQEALERGETTHLLPVENAKERIAKGELKPEDIP